MGALDYDKMDLAQKFSMLEELWQNMTLAASKSEFTPQWHLDTLDQREEAVKSGKSRFEDLQSAKSKLQKLL